MSNPPTTPDTAGASGSGLGNVLFDTWLVSRAVHSLIDDAIKPTGLDADEFAIYSVLSMGDGMTPSELSHWMSAPATTVSSYVKRFEKRGHIDRVPSTEDRRSYRLVLTPEGRTAHRAAGELFQPTLAAVDEALGKDGPNVHVQLLELRRIIDAIAAR
ncbi:MarR family winged helix-turn-helix transcriptional regulator [Ilumatobacter coccineus]|uniref:Putative MarR family transcriptional regulator n=1 Tax=Ilumatobacter coccineus (strain NBRC 103263 / KCTC 29153 / YM16-304) TaxID=1313172 RepID=A0A6C7ECR9_ILUCY|nr:MarR family winged helix-turn-helix transcriptional regulator [Ilumatobacter coccineus]BAN04567.1 putative MarR family transcriptional regulator [Ilumatobacter coccineus YM16-304]